MRITILYEYSNMRNVFFISDLTDFNKSSKRCSMNRRVPVQKRVHLKACNSGHDISFLVFLKAFDSICDRKPLQHKNTFMCMCLL